MKSPDFAFLSKYILKTPKLGWLFAKALPRLFLHPLLERKFSSGLSLPPNTLHIMVTDRCNFKCRMCQYSASASKYYQLNNLGDMQFQTLQRIIDTIPGSPIVCLTGGEPLLHPQIEKFIRYIKAKGLYCILTTNGWLLEKKAVDICDSHLDLLIISIDGVEKLHDQIRVPGSFRKASRGIELIQKRRDRPLLCVSEVINDLNFSILHEVVEWVNNIGIDILNINHLWIQSDKMVEFQNEISTLPKTGIINWGLSPETIEVDQLEASLHKVLRSARKFYLTITPFLKNKELKTYYQQPERLVKVSETRCAWMVTKVWPNGDVKICREYKAGNVLQDPLNKIWNNATYREFRRYLADHKVCPICSRCCFLFPRL